MPVTSRICQGRSLWPSTTGCLRRTFRARASTGSCCAIAGGAATTMPARGRRKTSRRARDRAEPGFMRVDSCDPGHYGRPWKNPGKIPGRSRNPRGSGSVRPCMVDRRARRPTGRPRGGRMQIRRAARVLVVIAGLAAPAAAETFPAPVEAWRSRIADKADGSDVPVDFLLMWVRYESYGNPCALGVKGHEAGIAQTWHPDDDRFG